MENLLAESSDQVADIVGISKFAHDFKAYLFFLLLQSVKCILAS